MRRLRFLWVLAAAIGLLTGCRPKDKIRVETPSPGNLKSAVNMADPTVERQLIRGFHNIEQNSWRWTAGKFSVLMKPPSNAPKGTRAVLRGTVPEALVSKVGPVTLTAMLNGGLLGRVTWNAAGEQTFSAAIPEGQLESEAITVDFSLDKFLAAGQADSRELGIIVTDVALEPIS